MDKPEPRRSTSHLSVYNEMKLNDLSLLCKVKGLTIILSHIH